MGTLIILFILIGVYFAVVFVGGVVIDWLFGKEDDYTTDRYIDRSTHTHTHYHIHTDKKSKEMKELEDFINSDEDAY